MSKSSPGGPYADLELRQGAGFIVEGSAEDVDHDRMKPHRTALVAAASTAVAALAGAASAHHSFAMFDFSKARTLPGVIKTFDWINPHIHILLEASDETGRAQAWEIEGPAPDTLRAQGWQRTALQPGDKVTLVVHPLKSGGLGASLVRAYRADGSLVGARPAAAPARPPG